MIPWTNLRARRSIAGLGALVVAGTLAAACGSSSSSGTTSTAAPGATATTAAGGGSSSTTSTPPASTGLGLGLLDKFQSGEHATFTASYKITSSTQSGSTLTIAQQSPNEVFKVVASSGTFEILTIGTKSYLCATGASAPATCLSAGKSNPEADLVALYEPSTYLRYFEAAAKAEGVQATYSSKTVNGFSLSCTTVSGVTGENGTGTFCVTAQGVLGYVGWTGSSPTTSGSFEITSYSTSVPSGEFTLPATPTTYPS